MEKLYGYKREDVNGLLNLIKQHEHKTLSQLFNDYSIKSGKSVGTIRNLYYAIARRVNADPETLNKFSIKSINVNTPKTFTKEDENKLLKQIINLKSQGHSVRSAVHFLANGDSKLALRYQNKYRNCIKNSSELLGEGLNSPSVLKEKSLPKISDFQMTKLKKEINCLVERIALNVTKENQSLRKRIGELQLENLKLKTMLFNGNF